MLVGVPLIAYKNEVLKADIHVESFAELKDVFRLKLHFGL